MIFATNPPLVCSGKIRDLLISRQTAAPGEVASVQEPAPEPIEEGTISERISKKGGRKSIRRDYSEYDDESYFAAVEAGDETIDPGTAVEVGLAHAKRIASEFCFFFL